MQIHEKFLRFLYSSSALANKDFEELSNNNGIFKKNFFESPSRKPIIEKLKKNIQLSRGGVFLVSGYRGTGKTTFLNYVLNCLKKEHPKQFIDDTFNLSSISFDLRFEIMCRIIFILKKHEKQFVPSIRKQIDKIYKILLWERTEVSGIKGDFGFEPVSKTSSHLKWLPLQIQIEKKRSERQKENIYYIETRLQELLNQIKNTQNKKVVIVLDELDKIPVLAQSVNDNKARENSEEKESENKFRQMDWLLKMLSDIKYFLFESGVVFILVVNKDVFDYWKFKHSDEDLFMNLVTSMLYIPSYFQEEMELSHDFKITLNEEVGFLSSFSPYSLKKYFQKCAYYESYANPRLLFQYLSRNIKDDQITIRKEDAVYLKQKVRLYFLIEMIYQYFYENKEIHFRQFLSTAGELYSVILKIMRGNSDNIILKTNPSGGFYRYYSRQTIKDSEKMDEALELFTDYYNFIINPSDFDKKIGKVSLKEFWNIPNSGNTKQDFYGRLEAFINVIKENDPADNFPATNYLIRRLTDFVKIIEERFVVSIEQIIMDMGFKTYEFNDIIGQYLITLLIPMSIILLKNNEVIKIKGKSIYYEYQHDENLGIFHKACRDEMEGDFEEAYQNYTQYLEREFHSIDAMCRFLRFLQYRKYFDYKNNKNFDYVFEWRNSLEKMDRYLIENKDRNPDYLGIANFYSFVFFYNNIVIKDEQIIKDMKKEAKIFTPQYNFEPAGSDKEPEDLYNKVIEENPTDPWIYQCKGFYLENKNRYAAALDCYEEALKYNNNSMVLIHKAEVLLRLGELNKAIDTYMKAEEFSYCWLHKAFIYYDLIKAKSSGKNANKIIKIMKAKGNIYKKIKNKDSEGYQLLKQLF